MKPTFKQLVLHRAVLPLVPIIGILLSGCEDENPYDIQATITIVEPTTDPTWSTSATWIRLAGTMEFSGRANFTNERTGKTYTGTVDTATHPFLWHVEITDLQPGDNPITAQAHLYNDGSGYDYITIIRIP